MKADNFVLTFTHNDESIVISAPTFEMVEEKYGSWERWEERKRREEEIYG